MFRFATAGLVVGTAALFFAAPAQAQWTPSLTVKAGATMPVGNFGDVTNVGYNIGVGGEFNRVGSPLGFRLEADFNENKFDDNGFDTFDESFRTLAITGNLVYGERVNSGPYFIGGAGLYRGWVPDSNVDSETKFGVNGGIGYRFALTGFSTFVEARYHQIFTDNNSTQMIPISFGVKF